MTRPLLQFVASQTRQLQRQSLLRHGSGSEPYYFAPLRLSALYRAYLPDIACSSKDIAKLRGGARFISIFSTHFMLKCIAKMHIKGSLSFAMERELPLRLASP